MCIIWPYNNFQLLLTLRCHALSHRICVCRLKITNFLIKHKPVVYTNVYVLGVLTCTMSSVSKHTVLILTQTVLCPLFRRDRHPYTSLLSVALGTLSLSNCSLFSISLFIGWKNATGFDSWSGVSSWHSRIWKASDGASWTFDIRSLIN